MRQNLGAFPALEILERAVGGSAFVELADYTPYADGFLVQESRNALPTSAFIT